MPSLRLPHVAIGALGLLLLLADDYSAQPLAPHRTGPRPATLKPAARMQVPIVFEPNLGQMASDDAFMSRGQGYAVAIKATGARVWLQRPDSPARVIEMALVAPAADATVPGADQGAGNGATASEQFPLLEAFQPDLVYVSVFISTDGASTFTPTALSVPVNDIAVDPTNSQIAYAATTQGIYKTTNGGAVWSRVDSGLTFTYVTSIVTDPNAPCTIYAGIDKRLGIFGGNTSEILVRSTDCGANWIPVAHPSGMAVDSLAMTTANPAVLYFSDRVVITPTLDTSVGVGRLTPTGYQTFGFDDFPNPAIVATDPANPCNAYFATSRRGIYKNTSCSAFNSSPVATPAGSITSLLVHPTNSATLLAGTQDGKIYRKVDDGSPWTVVKTFANFSNRGVVGMIHKPGSTSVVYAAAGGVVATSSDGGLSWTDGAVVGPTITQLAASPAAPDVVYASSVGGTVSNLRPTISDVSNQSISQGGSTSALPFIVADAETAATNLMVSAASSNTTLAPNGNVLLGGSGANRTVTITAAPGQTGTTTITLTVSDGALTASDTFIVTVTAAPNTPPTMSDVSNQSIPQGGSTAALPFVVGDAETAAASLVVTGSSSNPTLVPNGNVVLGGSGTNRTVTITAAPGQTGATAITLTVSDGALTASDSFVVTVTVAPNTPPSISNVADQTITQGTSTGALAITVGDAETPAAALTLSGSSQNQALVPNANIVFGGSGTARTVTVTPVAGQTGATTITVAVSDGILTAAASFVVTVVATPVLRPPTNLAIVAMTGNSVTLSWSAPTNSIPPTGYAVEGGLTPASVLGSLPTGSTATSFTFAAPTGAFYVRVHSLSGSAKSNASNEIRIFVNVPPPPSAPTNLTGTATGSSLALSWRNATTGGSPEFLLLDVTGALTLTMQLPVSESFSFTGVPPGAYGFAVRAGNRTDTSAPSNMVTLTFPSGCPAPGPPTNLSATRSGNIVTVSWTAPLTGVPPAGYTATVGGAFSGVFSTPGLSLSGAAGPGTYTLAVAATSVCGTGPSVNSQITVP